MTTSTRSNGRATGATDSVIALPQISFGTVTMRVIGDSPLVVHRWSDKARKEMLDKQMKRPRQAKAAKDPEQDYAESMYRYHNGFDVRDENIWDGKTYGFPATAFKAAAVAAVTHIDGLTKVAARGMFHINLGADLVKIIGEPKMREDMVRVQMTTDIRYRGEFFPWAADLTIRYNENAVSVAQIANMLNVAGFSIGVGESRPERNGAWGMFHVATEGE